MATNERSQVDDDSVSESARELLQVAARQFATRGYDATSVREIVEAAGVTKPTLYYHFGSKEGLAQALLTVPMRRLVNELRAIVDRGGDPSHRLAELIEAHFAFCREEPDRARFVYGLFFGLNAPGLTSEVARYGEQLTELVADAVQGLVRARIIPRHRAKRCSAAVQGLITHYTTDFLYQGANLGTGLGRRLVEDLLRGFSAVRARTTSDGDEVADLSGGDSIR